MVFIYTHTFDTRPTCNQSFNIQAIFLEIYKHKNEFSRFRTKCSSRSLNAALKLLIRSPPWMWTWSLAMLNFWLVDYMDFHSSLDPDRMTDSSLDLCHHSELASATDTVSILREDWGGLCCYFSASLSIKLLNIKAWVDPSCLPE